MPIILSVIVLKNTEKNVILFSTGACGYGLIEILWRGHTHWSMAIAGGISFLGLCSISEKMNGSLIKKAVAGSVFITAVELVFGIVFNILLDREVWDYSDRPFNIAGQICPLYSLFWVFLSLAFIPLGKRLSKALENK